MKKEPRYKSWILPSAFGIPAGFLISFLFGKFVLTNVAITTNDVKVTLPKASNGYFFPVRKTDFVVGDLVLYESPDSQNLFLLGRVVGIPGDRIKLEMKKLYRNGGVVPPEFAPEVFADSRNLPKALSNRDNLEEIKILPGTYFVMAENRDESLDSRHYGPIPENKISYKLKRE